MSKKMADFVFAVGYAAIVAGIVVTTVFSAWGLLSNSVWLANFVVCIGLVVSPLPRRVKEPIAWGSLATAVLLGWRTLLVVTLPAAIVAGILGWATVQLISWHIRATPEIVVEEDDSDGDLLELCHSQEWAWRAPDDV